MRAFIGLLGLAFINPLFALTVIADTGKTIPIDDYLLAAKSKEQQQAVSGFNLKPTYQTVGLPAKSTMSAGEVRDFRFDEPNRLPAMNLFVVGDDAISRQWLIKHAEFLKEQSALGFVTNIKSDARLEALRAIVGVFLMPVNTDVFIKPLGVHHYPFYTDGKELWQ